MPNSSTQSTSPPLYVPDSPGSMAGSSSTVDLPDYIERTMEAIEDYAQGTLEVRNLGFRRGIRAGLEAQALVSHGAGADRHG